MGVLVIKGRPKRTGRYLCLEQDGKTYEIARFTPHGEEIYLRWVEGRRTDREPQMIVDAPSVEPESAFTPGAAEPDRRLW